ncbi:MAG: GntR family transcriptional regulator [Candidatus Acidiferrales bacterium]|jgi:DNA-binding transcriptional regulator YhcF (GntR family)
MRFWFARNSEVPIREQIVTQIVLGILCDALKAGQRLPSTLELARRFHLHPNTISAAYRQLARERWVAFRRGSGVYVRKSKLEAPLSSALVLDQLYCGCVIGRGTQGPPALRSPRRTKGKKAAATRATAPT